jgi:hypothetical protein
MKGFSNVIPAEAGIQTKPHAWRWPSLDARLRGHDKVPRFTWIASIPINIDDAAH